MSTIEWPPYQLPGTYVVPATAPYINCTSCGSAYTLGNYHWCPNTAAALQAAMQSLTEPLTAYHLRADGSLWVKVLALNEVTGTLEQVERQIAPPALAAAAKECTCGRC